MATRGVSITEICTLLKGAGFEPLTPRAISGFVADGMPKMARGRYDAEVCTQWYLGRLRRSVQQRDTEGPDGQRISLDAVEIRLRTAKAESEEMNLAERRGELIPLFVYEKTLTALVAVSKQRLLNIPARLASKLEGCTTVEIKALLGAAQRGPQGDGSRSTTSCTPSRWRE